MKFLLRPLNKGTTSQLFGENKACIKDGKTITCDGLNPPAGWKSIYSNMKGHNGIDFSVRLFTPIYSSQDGWVEEYVAEEERGLGLGIITDRKFYCKDTKKHEHFKIRYWHNYVNLVQKGDKVKIGQKIALVGSTGFSSGPHLHFAIKPVKKVGSRWVNILQDNGYFGAVDPLPYLQPYRAAIFTDAKTMWDRLLIIFSMLK